MRLCTQGEDTFSLGGADTNYYPYRVWAEGSKRVIEGDVVSYAGAFDAQGNIRLSVR